MMMLIHTVRREQALDAAPDAVFAYRAERVAALLSRRSMRPGRRR
jgi:hypothetical protein